MKTPIRTEPHPLSSRLGIFDADSKYVDLENVCDAINNAAAGSRETGPVPDGENEGDLLLLLYESPEKTEVLMWSGGAWNMSFDDFWEPIDEERTSPKSWARINFPKQQEAAK